MSASHDKKPKQDAPSVLQLSREVSSLFCFLGASQHLQLFSSRVHREQASKIKKENWAADGSTTSSPITPSTNQRLGSLRTFNSGDNGESVRSGATITRRERFPTRRHVASSDCRLSDRQICKTVPCRRRLVSPHRLQRATVSCRNDCFLRFLCSDVLLAVVFSDLLSWFCTKNQLPKVDRRRVNKVHVDAEKRLMKV